MVMTLGEALRKLEQFWTPKNQIKRRLARNGMWIFHWALRADPDVIHHYKLEYEDAIVENDLPGVIRSEARYFGYPSCCAEAFIREPYALNDLAIEEQALLFHHACPGCQATPKLLPLYRAALAEARSLYKRLLRSRGGVEPLTVPCESVRRVSVRASAPDGATTNTKL